MGGSLTEQEIYDIKARGSPYSEIENFVETGTYKAETTLMAAKHFKNVYTMEIYEPLYKESMERANDEKVNNINFYLGDSLDCLPEIALKVRVGAIYFIDAHISGGDSSWNGKNRVPLIEELDIIISEPIGPSVFILDDLRLWKTIKAWDWEHITNESIIKKLKDKGIKIASYFEQNDRFFVFTK